MGDISTRREAKIFSNILLPIIAVLAMNALVFGMHWNSESHHRGPWLNPPGELIGAVWIVLFVLMGVARYRVQKAAGTQSSIHARQIVYYMLFCLSYPLYTLGLKSEMLGLIGNAATFVAAAYLITNLRGCSPAAAWCLAPVLPWLIYASATML